MTETVRWRRSDWTKMSYPIQWSSTFLMIYSLFFFILFSTVEGYEYPDQHVPPPQQSSYYEPQQQYSYNSYSAPSPPRYEQYPAITYQELNASYHCGVIPDTNFELYRDSDDSYAVADVAPYGKFPWIVLILLYNKVVCQGTLIHHNFILTSARCISEYKNLEDYEIRIGDWDLLTDYNEYEAYHDREVRVCSRHTITTYNSPGGYSYGGGSGGGKGYKRPQTYYDDSSDLIILKSEFESSDKFPHARPLCLPKTYQPQSYSYYGSSQDVYAPYAVCWVAGWYGSEITQLQNHPQPQKVMGYDNYEHHSPNGHSRTYHQRYYKGTDYSMIQKRAKVKQVDCPSYGNNYGYSSNVCFIGIDGYDACVAEQGAAVFCVIKEESTYGDYNSGYNNQDASSYNSKYGSADASYNFPVVSSLHPGYERYSKPPIKAAPSPSKPSRYRAILYAVIQKPAKCRVGYDSYGYGISRKSRPLVATRVGYQTVNGIMDQFWANGYDQSCPASKSKYKAPPQRKSYKNNYYFGSYYNTPTNNNYGYNRYPMNSNNNYY